MDALGYINAACNSRHINAPIYSDDEPYNGRYLLIDMGSCYLWIVMTACHSRTPEITTMHFPPNIDFGDVYLIGSDPGIYYQNGMIVNGVPSQMAPIKLIEGSRISIGIVGPYGVSTAGISLRSDGISARVSANGGYVKFNLILV